MTDNNSDKKKRSPLAEKLIASGKDIHEARKKYSPQSLEVWAEHEVFSDDKEKNEEIRKILLMYAKVWNGDLITMASQNHHINSLVEGHRKELQEVLCRWRDGGEMTLAEVSRTYTP
jgi:hypothetical protein